MPVAADESNPRMIKRPKHSRACSLCRRKKIRCDASEKPDLRCSKCAMYGAECHYEHNADRPPNHTDANQLNTREGRASDCSYAEMLETRIRAMEDVLRTLRSGKATNGLEEGSAAPSLVATTTRRAPYLLDVPALPSYSVISPPRLSTLNSGHINAPDSSDDEEGEGPWAAVVDGGRYHGKSSSDFLVRTLAGFKADTVNHPLPWSGHSTPRDSMNTPPSRDVISSRPLSEELPFADLLATLVDAYFKEFNSDYPLLHRPTFERCMREELHVRDDSFCAVVLLVCANGSRWVEDDRLQRIRGHPPGLHWFERAGCVTSIFLEKPRLYDLQALILTAAYMNGTDSPYGTWTVLGVGVRMAQDVGAHRKKTYGSTPTVEDELWRRAFWVLVAMDRLTSFGMGRPCAIHEEDFDVDPMTECDDEYWTPADPTLAFKQPPDRPSKIAFFNCLGRLLRILAFASRTIYTTNKSKLLFGFVGPEWKQGVVAELDSALNEWLDSVPEHLRWDPNMQDPTFFNQSATLYANYYQAQICIHRQFLPSRRKPSLASLPSLAICTSAARSCVSVLYAQHLRTGLTKCTLCSMLVPLNTAALILVIALSASKANGREREVEAIADEIGKCFEMLLSMEPYHQGIGKFRAALHGLLVAERPTTSSTRTAGSSAPSNEPRFFGADDLGGLVVAMMNNLSLSSPQADLEDVGPFWGHPAEAPFYGPKPKFSVQHPADAESISEPPGAQMQREASTEELQVQAASVHRDGARPIVSPPSYANSGAVPVAHTPGMPTFEIPLSPPLSLDVTDEGSIDFTPFFVENERLGLGMSVPGDPYAAPSTMLPVARSDWDTFL